MVKKSISSKSLDFETYCPHCKTLVEGEIIYSHIKKLFNGEKIEIECNYCNEDFEITKKIIKKSLNDLSEVEILELNEYINSKSNVKKNSFFLNEYTIRLLLLALFFFLLFNVDWEAIFSKWN